MNHLWPRLVPIESEPGVFPVVSTIYYLMKREPAVFYSYCANSILAERLVQGELDGKSPPQLFSLELKEKALHRLQERIDGDDPLADEVILTVIALASHEFNPEALALCCPLSSSPFARMQTLETVGYMRPNIAHVEAMYNMVAKRGGLDNIRSPGIAYIMALSDLLMATFTLSTPRFTLFWPNASLVKASCLIADEAAENLFSTFGSRFLRLNKLTRSLIDDFLELLPSLREVTVAVDMHHRSNGTPSKLGPLVSVANSVHWRLLALGDAGSSSTTKPSTLAQAIRLSALIYSDFVVFPVNPVSRIRDKLSEALHNLLQGCYVLDTDLLLWLLVMGGIGSRYKPSLRTLYVETVQGLAGRIRIRNIKRPEYLLEVLRGFLWWDVVMDDELVAFWAETGIPREANAATASDEVMRDD